PYSVHSAPLVVHPLRHSLSMLNLTIVLFFFFFSSRRRHTRWPRDWSSDVCSSDLAGTLGVSAAPGRLSGAVVGYRPAESTTKQRSFTVRPASTPPASCAPERNRVFTLTLTKSDTCVRFP